MPALINGMRTQAGRFVNHSVTPNCEMVKRPNGDVDLVALEDLHGCIGGNAGQELTVDYRHLFAFIKDLEV
jgi:SET domain-containing protein